MSRYIDREKFMQVLECDKYGFTEWHNAMFIVWVFAFKKQFLPQLRCGYAKGEGMTETEIMKALECCKAYNYDACSECPFNRNADCSFAVATNCLDLINRKNAEIERLKSHSGKCIYLSDDETMEFCVEGACKQFKTEEQIRVEAIKEFAERAKDVFTTIDGTFECWEVEEHIDQIAKEMGVE